MPMRVDFYVVERGDADTVACRIADKAFGQGLTVFVRTGDGERSRRLDDLMWTFNGLSFLPHAPQGEADDDTPVQIGERRPDGPVDLVINLADEPPDDVQGCARIAEIVGPTPAEKRAARSRFRYYRDKLDSEPQTHHIGQ